MKIGAIAVTPLLAGCLLAQVPGPAQSTTTTTTTTSWNGTLVDAACQSSRTERRESKVETNENITTRTNTTHTTTVDCPVTTTTTAFGLLTPDGKFVRFDPPSNTKVVQIVRSNRAFESPATVTVVGSLNGDVAVVETLTPAGAAVAVAPTTVETQHSFDVRYDGDRGKLIVTDSGLRYEGIEDAKHSRQWSYSQIKEFRRDGRELEIEPYSGSKYELKLEGREMSNEAYKLIADRIVAARGK